ncbi:MAG TPA: endonuclease domain-containing protein [Allosphingosinicella sp.]|jgi:very-short-patch-repair endonuclease
MSPPEALLWQHLRARPGGFKFRRQRPLGPYFLDFYCRSAALCIEVDGDAHDMGTAPEDDARRDQWLASRGIRTVRFLAADVGNDTEAVVRHIEDLCASRSPSTGDAGPPPRQRPGRIG